LRKALCAVLVGATLLAVGCAKPAPAAPAAPVTAPLLPWPAGWPTSAFPAPPPGVVITRTFQGGAGYQLEVVFLDATGSLADSRAWLDAGAAKFGLQKQNAQDAVLAEVNMWFGTPEFAIADM